MEESNHVEIQELEASGKQEAGRGLQEGGVPQHPDDVLRAGWAGAGPGRQCPTRPARRRRRRAGAPRPRRRGRPNAGNRLARQTAGEHRIQRQPPMSEADRDGAAFGRRRRPAPRAGRRARRGRPHLRPAPCGTMTRGMTPGGCAVSVSRPRERNPSMRTKPWNEFSLATPSTTTGPSACSWRNSARAVATISPGTWAAGSTAVFSEKYVPVNGGRWNQPAAAWGAPHSGRSARPVSS